MVPYYHVVIHFTIGINTLLGSLELELISIYIRELRKPIYSVSYDYMSCMLYGKMYQLEHLPVDCTKSHRRDHPNLFPSPVVPGNFCFKNLCLEAEERTKTLWMFCPNSSKGRTQNQGP